MTLTAPPDTTSEVPRWRRMVTPTLVIGGLGALTVGLHLRDPHDQGSWGVCPLALVGVDCPGCGGLRAVNDLTNGDVGAAASSNLLLVVAVPFVVYGLLRWSIGRWTGRGWALSERARTATAVVALVAIAVFAVVRNLPAGGWLAS